MKYFGTDGIRGIPPKTLTEDTIRQIGNATCRYIEENKLVPKICIAKDTRDSSDYIISLLSSVFLFNGIDVFDIGIAPTPCLSHVAKSHMMGLGIMISASHNPSEYNGIKFFDGIGQKLSESQEEEIESKMGESERIGTRFGKLVNAHPYVQDYIRLLKSRVKYNFPIIVDCANGASSEVATEIFENAIFISNNTEGVINDDCGCTHPSKLQQLCKLNDKFGVAFDGDADRVLLVDPEGNMITGDHILYILATKLSDITTVVGTQMTNFGLEVALKNKGMSLVREKVGDRYIAERMRKQSLRLGGEQSGHIIIADQACTGDGLNTAINVLNIIGQKGEQKLLDGYTDFPQILYNLEVTPEQKELMMKDVMFSEYIRDIESELYDEGRILVRASGTENLIRIMLEGKSKDTLDILLDKILGFIHSHFANLDDYRQ